MSWGDCVFTGFWLGMGACAGVSVYLGLKQHVLEKIRWKRKRATDRDGKSR